MSVLQLLGRRKKSNITPVLTPGTPYGGGYYVGQIRASGKLYNLVVADKSAETSLAWRTTNTPDTGVEYLSDGKLNTAGMFDDNLYPAAKYCRAYRGGGFNDWYLGSRDEMELAYRVFKPDTTANSTSVRDSDSGGGPAGVNNNSVPLGSAYTLSNPPVTNVLSYRASPPGSQFFSQIGIAYWTSTQALGSNKNLAIARFFNSGLEMGVPKNNSSGLVRPMRRVLVENPDIGSYYEGGYYFGNIKIGPEEYRLVVAPQSTETIRAFKTNTNAETDGYSFVDGLANCLGKNNANYPAIQYCMSLNIDGYADWYLGARDEVELIYRNLKPRDANNSFGARQEDAGGGQMGENLNSNPVGVPYTQTTPKQTTVDIFKSGGSQAMGGVSQKGGVWTSTATPAGTTPDYQIYQQLYSGFQAGYPKTSTTDIGVRAIRRVHIAPNYGVARDGGYFGGRIKIGEDYYDLIVAPKSAELALPYKSSAVSVPGTTSRFDGEANTANLTQADCLAANHCRNYRGGGYSDWYFGSLLEMEAIFRNLKCTSTNNSTVTRDPGLGGGKEGENPYSSPIGTAYTLTSPGVTKDQNFVFTSGVSNQAFERDSRYWTSTETVGAGYGPYAAIINMANGGTTYSLKSVSGHLVRPIRKVKVVL